MNTWSFEGIVRQDQIELPPNVHLPDDTKVIVIVQTESPGKIAHVYSPRLVNPAQAGAFVLEVTEESTYPALTEIVCSDQSHCRR